MDRTGLLLPFKLFGVAVRLDYSFLLVLPLFAYLIGGQLPAYAELFEASMGIEVDVSTVTVGATRWLIGLAGAVGLFASVLLHEAGHALVARRYGVEVKEIRLWFLGGVAQFDDMPRQRGAEAVVAIVGPIVSFAIGFVLLRLAPALVGSGAVFMVVAYLGVTNVALALFNLLPAIPLDGGRVLRSVLALALPRERATIVATSVSAAMAVLLGLYGFFTMQLWLVILAFFIYNAGRLEAQASIVASALDGRSVADLMTRDPVTVAPDMRLTQFAQLIHFRPHTGYPVVDSGGTLLGFARLASAGRPAADQAAVTGPVAVDPEASVADITEPAETISPTASAYDALREVAEGRLGRLVVVDTAGRVVGLLSKTDLVRTLSRKEATRDGRSV